MHRSYWLVQLFFRTNYFVDLFLPLLSGHLFCKKRVALHKVVDVDKAPVCKVQSLSHHVFFLRVVNQTKSWRCFQSTFKYSYVITSVVSFCLTILGLCANFAKCTFSNLHRHAESHLKSTLTHLFPLFMYILLQLLSVHKECLRVFLRLLISVLF